MGFYFLIFNCFLFVCTNLLVWLNSVLVNIIQFSFLQFKTFYSFLHFLLYDIIFNDLKLYISYWCLQKYWVFYKKKNKVMFFWYIKVYIFWKLIQYTMYWHKIKMLKKPMRNKISVTNNRLLFLFTNSNSWQFHF